MGGLTLDQLAGHGHSLGMLCKGRWQAASGIAAWRFRGHHGASSEIMALMAQEATLCLGAKHRQSLAKVSRHTIWQEVS